MSLLSIVLGGVGGAVGGTAGAAVGSAVGTALDSGGGSGTQNPGGPASFARWAQEGHFDWVSSVALYKSGPDWQKDPSDTGSPWKTGYSPADAQSAANILAQYHRDNYGKLLAGYTAASAPAAAATTVASTSTPTTSQSTVSSVIQSAAQAVVGVSQATATAKSSTANTALWVAGGVAAFGLLLVLIYTRKD